MSKTIVALGASSSRNSINKKLATFAAESVGEADVNVLDLYDYEMPIYSIDKEKEGGIPQLAHDFKAELKEADGIIISFAEHNGAYSAAFKNIMDWISRIEKDVWCSKPMLLMATSPGGRGGATVLDIAMNKFKFMNSNTLVDYSLPFFNDNFSEEEGITNEELRQAFEVKLAEFINAL